MKLEDIMLSEVSQSQKINIVWFHLYEVQLNPEQPGG